MPQPGTSDKPLKPLDASKPAAKDQKPEKAELEPLNNHPSASPAKPSDKPLGGEHGSIKQEQKKAAYKKAEILSLLYKFGCDAVCSKTKKKSAMKKAIKAAGVEKVANFLLKVR